MIKEFLMKKMLRSQLKGMPEAEQDKMIKLVVKNPEFFQSLATEIKTEIKNGKDQQSAAIEVMGRHKDKLQKILNS